MAYMTIMDAAYAAARQQLRQLLVGVCTVYALQVQEVAGVCCGEFWQPLADWSDLPCYLAFGQNEPARTDSAADGSGVEARFQLFLPPAEPGLALPAGSRVRVEQWGQVYWLACSGQAACYPTHMEVKVRLLDERA